MSSPSNPILSAAAAGPSPPVVQPIQYTQLTEADLKSPALLNTLFSQLFTQVNALLGVNGPAPLTGGIDAGGQPVRNIGPPSGPTDAVSLLHAERSYSAAALAPQLEAGGSATLKTFRALNSKQQQEHYSTFLNAVSNTSPTTNTTTVSATSSGGDITFTVPAGYHLRVDGSSAAFGSFTATVPAPTAQAVTSATRSGGISTLLGSFTGLTAGESINVTSVSDPTFDGTFVLLGAGAGSLTYSQPTQPDVVVPATGGTVSTLGAYYCYLRFPSQQLALSGPFADDSQQNRLASNVDGQVLIAVVVINSDGLVTDQTAAGATPPAATGNFRLLARL